MRLTFSHDDQPGHVRAVVDAAPVDAKIADDEWRTSVARSCSPQLDLRK